MTAAPQASWNALPGFLLSGFLLAMLGAILPAWGYHRDPADFVAVGNYFLALAIGLVGATYAAPRILERRGLSFLLLLSCALSGTALAYLALVGPPYAAAWRMLGTLVLGAGAGLLNGGLFQALSVAYVTDAAGTVIRGGIWYGLGCLLATLLVLFFTAPAVLWLMAAAPAIFAILFRRAHYVPTTSREHPRLREAVKDFNTSGAILFALLLFFQFGNEWSFAGWLPLLLIRRIGLSPKAALFHLSLYWLFLMGGRMLAVSMLPRVGHGKLLVGCVFSALFGCLILFFTNNAFGAGSGVLFLGAGYASIYPLVAEAIGRRFPYYHPGFFNGIFALALVGGLLAPATLGYAADVFGVGVVIGLPLMGTFVVLLLVPLIWLETKVTGR